MDCYYHNGRESSDNCTICNKPICKECGLELSGKIYCKECLEKIISSNLGNIQKEEPVKEKQFSKENEPVEQIYEDVEKNIPKTLTKKNSKDNLEPENPSTPEENYYIAKEKNFDVDDTPSNINNNENLIDNFNPAEKNIIYPDHTYQPSPRDESLALEEKYEKYLDNFYDNSDLSLQEQLAKDEEAYGPLTNKPYEPPVQETEYIKYDDIEYEPPQKQSPYVNDEVIYPEHSRNRPNVVQQGQNRNVGRPIPNNIHYKKEEKESFNIIDAVLAFILVVLIIIVILYVFYLLVQSNSYPTFTDALVGLLT